MNARFKRIYGTITSDDGGIDNANRFVSIVFALVMLVDEGLLIYTFFTNDYHGVDLYTELLSSSITDYILCLALVFFGGVLWLRNLEQGNATHTAIIFAVMISVVQVLSLGVGIYVFAAYYVVIILTVVYAKPLFTLIISAIIYIIAFLNYWTTTRQMKQLFGANENGLKEYSDMTSGFFFDSIYFFLPTIIIVTLVLCIFLKSLRKYLREYAAKQSMVEASNMAAAQIQSQIIDSSHIDETAIDNVSVYPFLETADYVAGDFYDYYNIDRFHICFMIADVSGKGIAAGLFMVRAKEVLKVIVKDHFEPSNIMERANKLLCENNVECMFATAWVGILDIRSGHIKYSNAGHTSPVLISNGRVVTLNEVSGPMLGVFPNKKYKSHSVTIGEGDRILLYTDGVTEQPIGDDIRYDEKKLIKCIKDNLDRDNLCQCVYEDIAKYNQKQFDDITMLQMNLCKLKKSTAKIGKSIRTSCYMAASPSAIRIFRKRLYDELESSDVSKDFISTFYVACEEMLTNVVRYAYGSTDNNGGIVVDLLAEDDYMAVVIKDSGVEFNPFLYDNSVIANQSDSLSEGGRGIKIFTEIMDEYSYMRKSDTNIVTGRKYI